MKVRTIELLIFAGLLITPFVTLFIFRLFEHLFA